MIGYIVQPYQLEIVKTVNVIDYELPLESLNGISGRATVAEDVTAYERYFLALEDYPDKYFPIEKTMEQNNVTTLSILDPLSVLDGLVWQNIFTYDTATFYFIVYTQFFARHTLFNPDVYSARFTPSAEAYAKTIQPDLKQFSVNGDSETGFMSCSSIVRWMCNNGFSAVANVGETPQYYGKDVYYVLNFDLYDSEPETIYFGDGHSEIISQSYDNKVISYVLAWGKFVGAGSTLFENIHAYLLDDGSATYVTGDDPPPMNQAKGDPSLAEYDYTNDPSINTFLKCQQALLESVKTDIFANNEHHHQIVFMSDAELHIGQTVKLIFKDKVVDSVISQVTVKSTDDRFQYTCGDLPVTASQQIKDNSWSYAKNLPVRPYKGQLVFM